MQLRRVVITGIGTITSAGLGSDKFWSKIKNSESFIDKIKSFDVSSINAKIGSEIIISDDEFLTVINQKELLQRRRIDDFIFYGLIAASEAINDSKILEIINDDNSHKFGVLTGSGIGGLKTIINNLSILNTNGANKVSPFTIPGLLTNLLPGNIAIKFGFKGPNFGIVSACATGAHSIGEAFNYIRFGMADGIIAGGSESALSLFAMSAFDSMKALSRKYNDTPQLASRPFDKDRDGFVMSDGSAIVVIEEYESAKKRGAKIYAEIVGYGLSCDAEHITTPNENGIGAQLAMKNALQVATLQPEQIDYINAHGTSTQLGDIVELKAIKNIFGENYGTKIPISSTKSMTGHLLGASGSLEAIISVKSLEESLIPANINYCNPDEISKDFNIITSLMQKNMSFVMSNSFGFGGTNCSLIFKKI